MAEDRNTPGARFDEGRHDQEAIEALTLVVAHLAAQLTMTQMRLRALATALEASGTVDPAMVRGHLLEIADHETGFYLLENLGERLSTLIEVDELSRDIIDFLGQPG
jgi:hypothetical protein